MEDVWLLGLSLLIYKSVSCQSAPGHTYPHPVLPGWTALPVLLKPPTVSCSAWEGERMWMLDLFRLIQEPLTNAGLVKKYKFELGFDCIDIVKSSF